MSVSEASASISSETPDLATLVDHREHVGAEDSLESVYRDFEKHGQEYAAVLDGKRPVGIVSRGQVGFVLGSRYGFQIYGRRPARAHMLPRPVFARRDDPLLSVLGTALARSEEDFHDDIGLTDKDGALVGLVTVRTLVGAQSRLLREQLFLAESRRSDLHARNDELSRSIEELRRSRSRFETLVENVPLGVALVAADGSIETQNGRLAAMLPGDRPRDLADLFVAEDAARFRRVLADLATGGGAPATAAAEYRSGAAPGERRVLHVSTALVPETHQITACVEDVTEQRELDRRAAQQEKSALLETLVGGIAHELNNKLAPVMGFAELVAQTVDEGASPPHVGEYARAILGGAAEAATIIRQLLNLAKPPEGDVAVCDLREIVDDALGMCRFRIREVDADVERVFAPTAVLVAGDAPQLKQVAINLVLNALDAVADSPVRGLVLRVDGSDDSARIEVSDSGPGVPPDVRGRIFDPFFTTKSPDRGTGLGLSVSLSIVRRHGGDIELDPSSSRGATFRVALPRLDGDRRRAPTTQPPRGLRRPALRARVLVADDEPAVRSLAAEVLRVGLGCDVEVCADGAEALAKIEGASWDLVVTDLRMPVVDGAELCERLAQGRPGMLARVIVMSGDPSSGDVGPRLARLGVRVIAKPFHPLRLIEGASEILHAAAEAV